MAHEFVYRRRIQFADTDTADVAHFSAFFRFMEEAEHAFYRSLGTVAYAWETDRVVGTPRVAASCEYLRPVRYGDELDIRLVVVERTDKAIGYEVEFRLPNDSEPEPVARGSMRVVYAVRPHGSQDWRAAPLPPEIRDHIEIAPPGPAD